MSEFRIALCKYAGSEGHYLRYVIEKKIGDIWIPIETEKYLENAEKRLKLLKTEKLLEILD
jgi:hypothetical protein